MSEDFVKYKNEDHDEWTSDFFSNALGLMTRIKKPYGRRDAEFMSIMAQVWATLHLAKTIEDASKRIEEKLNQSNFLSAELENAYKVIADYQANIPITFSSLETCELMEDEVQKIKNLYEACMAADAAGDLDERVTGKILDEAGKALGITR